MVAKLNFVEILLIIFILKLDMRTYGQNVEEELISKLFTNYNRIARPVLDPTTAVQLNLSFALVNLDNLDAKRQILDTLGWLTIRWYDPRFKWNKTEYMDLETIIVPPNKVWLPDIVLYNTVGQLFQADHYKYFYVRVFHTGKIEWVPGGSFHSNCDIDIKLFPFDKQVCELIFASWMYTDNTLTIRLESDVVNKEVYKTNMEWTLQEHTVHMVNQSYISLDDNGDTSWVNYSEVHVRLHLQREPLYFIINILIPCILLSCLLLLVFWVSPDSGERIAMGFTILLAFSVFSLTIAEKIPRTSAAVPLISVYLMFFMLTSCFTVATSVLVGYLHNQSINPPPVWLRHLAFKFIGPFAGSVKKQAALAPSLNRQTNLIEMEQTENSKKEINEINREVLTWIRKTNENLKIIKTKLGHLDGTETIQDDHVTEWRTIASIIDTFCFRLFLFLIVSLTVLILGLFPFIKFG